MLSESKFGTPQTPPIKTAVVTPDDPRYCMLVYSRQPTVQSSGCQKYQMVTHTSFDESSL